jgi:hypothetical protein
MIREDDGTEMQKVAEADEGYMAEEDDKQGGNDLCSKLQPVMHLAVIVEKPYDYQEDGPCIVSAQTAALIALEVIQGYEKEAGEGDAEGHGKASHKRPRGLVDLAPAGQIDETEFSRNMCEPGQDEQGHAKGNGK